jgi:hypothetical protein
MQLRLVVKLNVGVQPKHPLAGQRVCMSIAEAVKMANIADSLVLVSSVDSALRSRRMSVAWIRTYDDHLQE